MSIIKQIFSDEQRAEIILNRIIDNARVELEKLEKTKRIDTDNLLMNVGKLIGTAAKLEK